jgi:hypothetical protein
MADRAIVSCSSRAGATAAGVAAGLGVAVGAAETGAVVGVAASVGGDVACGCGVAAAPQATASSSSKVNPTTAVWENFGLILIMYFMVYLHAWYQTFLRCLGALPK